MDQMLTSKIIMLDQMDQMIGKQGAFFNPDSSNE